MLLVYAEICGHLLYNSFCVGYLSQFWMKRTSIAKTNMYRSFRII